MWPDTHFHPWAKTPFRNCYLAAALLLSEKSHVLTQFDADLGLHPWKSLKVCRWENREQPIVLSCSLIPLLHKTVSCLLADVTSAVCLSWVWKLCGLPLPLLLRLTQHFEAGNAHIETGWHTFGDYRHRCLVQIETLTAVIWHQHVSLPNLA